jgi:drug/metabolite transporter (DMT)-like permease
VSSVLLAALCGLVWGVGDFAGGKAAQRAASLPVAWGSKVVGLPLLGLYLLLTYVGPQWGPMAWGALAGAAGMAGLGLFYRALAGGAMAVVAPVTAVTSAAIPVVVGLLLREPATGPRLLGVGCALAAIAMVSLAPRRPGEPARVTGALLALAFGAGASFALFFLLTAQAGRVAVGPAGLWPVLASQVSALALGGSVILLRRPGPWPQGRSVGWMAIAGPFDMTANALFLLASRAGEVSLVAPLASLYPVSTVILALAVDRERLRAVQVLGLGLAVAALLLVSV